MFTRTQVLRQFAPALIASALLLSTALAERTWISATQSDADIEAVVERLPLIPESIGSWVGRDLPLDTAQRNAAGVAGGLVREYTHRESGRSFTVTLLVGPVAAIAVHPPTACFRGQGHQIVGEAVERSFPSSGSRHTFQFARFLAPGPVPRVTDVAWSWCGDQCESGWNAPRSPRWTFAGRPYLKKLYISCVNEPDRRDASKEPSPFDGVAAQEFLGRIVESAGRL
jgi:hypothetical protein